MFPVRKSVGAKSLEQDVTAINSGQARASGKCQGLMTLKHDAKHIDGVLFTSVTGASNCKGHP